MFPASAENEIISLVDQRVLSIPVKESHEPLVDLKDQSTILFGPSPEVPNNQDYTKIRLSIYDKLIKAQENLPNGYLFCLYEGYRSLTLQQMLFDGRYQLLYKQSPHRNHEQLFKETTKLVAPVINFDGSRNIPPHSTGAAIDIYLIDKNKQVVDMGIRVEDWMQDVDGSLSKTDSAHISVSAQQNRNSMSDSLKEAGFINYPGEYWHWSYGDRYWAYHIGQKTAYYGTLE
jgi:D-alanyl-D-alanine dipeptidase